MPAGFFHCDSHLTPEERFCQVAAIFVLGISRVRAAAPLPPLELIQDSRARGLEVSRQTVLTVTNPVNGAGEPEHQE